MLLAAAIPICQLYAKPDSPVALIFAKSPLSPAQIHAMESVRAKLRAGNDLTVLSYDPDSPSIKRASIETHHPDWLVAAPLDDGPQTALAEALGARFVIDVGRGGMRGHYFVHVVDTASSSRTWSWDDVSLDEAVNDTRGIVMGKIPLGTGPVIKVEPATPKVDAIIAPLAVPVAPKTDTTVAPPATTTPVAVPTDTTSSSIVLASPSLDPLNAARAKEKAALLVQIQPLLAQSDDQLTKGNVVEAISLLRSAVNEAPFASEPRIKLAKAYIEAGLQDRALDEAKRALALSPDSVPIQEFLIQFDADSGTSNGAILRYSALVAKNPSDVSAHIGLGEAYWNSGSLAKAESELKVAETLSNPTQHEAASDLLRLYAAQERYDDCLDLIKANPTWDGYSMILRVLQPGAEGLIARIDSGKDAVEAKSKTRAAIYSDAKNVAKSANALMAFVSKITPPAGQKLSYLHRVQAVDLLSQEAAIFVSYLETASPDEQSEMDQLEKSAQTELLTAHASEAKSGLWVGSSDDVKG